MTIRGSLSHRASVGRARFSRRARLERLAGRLQYGFQTAGRLHAAHGDVAILRVKFDAIADPPGSLGGDQAGSGTDKGIENYAFAVRAIADGVGTKAAGLTVGCSARSSRPSPKPLAPA